MTYDPDGWGPLAEAARPALREIAAHFGAKGYPLDELVFTVRRAAEDRSNNREAAVCESNGAVVSACLRSALLATLGPDDVLHEALRERPPPGVAQCVLHLWDVTAFETRPEQVPLASGAC